MINNLNALGSYSAEWVNKWKKKKFEGASFSWNKSKAASFAKTSIEDLLFDPYFLNGKKWIWPGILETLLEIWEAKKERNINTVLCLGGFGCLPAYAPIKTNSGYTTIGDVKIGDRVLGVDDSGKTTKTCNVINKIYSGKKEVFRVFTSDGLWVDATKEHNFPVVYRRDGRDIHSVWKIGKIIDSLDNHKIGTYIPSFKKVDYITYQDTPKLKIDPWVLGLMLGDGSIREESIHLTSGDDDVAIREEFNKRIKKYGCHLTKQKQDFVYGVTAIVNHKRNNLLRLFKEYGISSKNKFIPEDYFHASKEDRLQLLAGLIDSDGHLNKTSEVTYDFVQKRKNLVEETIRLVSELGGRALLKEKIVNEVIYYRTYITPNFIVPCIAKRKQMSRLPKRDSKKRKVVSYKSLGVMDTFDITLDNKQHTFLSYNDIQCKNSGKTGGIGGLLTWLNWFDFSTRFDPNSDIACPQEVFGLKPTSKVAFIALSKTVKKSKEITFSEMIPPFHSQFNKDYFPVDPRVKSAIRVSGNNTFVIPNTATEAANAGYSIYSYVMDEISFLEVIEESARARGSTAVYDQARASHNSADGRRFSRFKDEGMGILISSVNYDEDYLMTLMRDYYNNKEENPKTYSKVLLPWKANPGKFNMDDGYFYFDTDKFEIIKDPRQIAALEHYYIEPAIEDLIFKEKDTQENPNVLVLEALNNGKIKLKEEDIENAKLSLQASLSSKGGY